jgi:hypothetical protein
VQGIQAKLVEVDPDIEPKRFIMWQTVYGDWTNQAAKYAKMALDAGVAERQVRIAEAQGEAFAGAIKAILEELGLSTEQQKLAPAAVRKHLTLLSA